MGILRHKGEYKINIGFLATFPNPADPNSSKAGYRAVTELIKLLTKSHEVTLYSISKYEWGLSVPFCSQVVPIRSTNPLALWLKTFRRLMKDRKRMGMFIAYNPTISTSPVLLLNILCSIPIIVYYVDKQGNNITSRYMAVRLIQLLIEKIFLLTIDNWLTSSNHLEKAIKRSRKGAAVMLFRGVFFEEELPEFEEVELPSIGDKEVNIAYMGGLHYDNGVDILIKAFSQLPPQNVHLYISGSGPLKPALEDLVQGKELQNVSFMQLDEKVVHAFMNAMDVLVIPHKQTRKNEVNFPSKIIEYLWAGKAIVSTSVGNAKYVFEDGKTAILIEPDNEHALREALAGLIADREKRTSLGRNARKYFEENLSVNAVRDRVIVFLHDVSTLRGS